MLPESLSDKIMKERELNNYIQKALSTVNKKKPVRRNKLKKKKTRIQSNLMVKKTKIVKRLNKIRKRVN